MEFNINDKLPISESNNFMLDVILDIDNSIIGKHILYNVLESDSEFSTCIGKVLGYSDSKLKIYQLYEILSDEMIADLENKYEVLLDIDNIKDIRIFNDYIKYDSNRELFINNLNNYCQRICELTNVYDEKIVCYLFDVDYCDEISITFEYKNSNGDIVRCIYPTCMIKEIKLLDIK